MYQVIKHNCQSILSTKYTHYVFMSMSYGCLSIWNVFHQNVLIKVIGPNIDRSVTIIIWNIIARPLKEMTCEFFIFYWLIDCLFVCLFVCLFFVCLFLFLFFFCVCFFVCFFVVCLFFEATGFILGDIENENSFCWDSTYRSMAYGSKSPPLSYPTCDEWL